MSRLAPMDSWFVFASDLNTDMLMVYAFDGVPQNLDDAIESVMTRARECPELRLRISTAGYERDIPRWVSGEVEDHQVVERLDASLRP